MARNKSLPPEMAEHLRVIVERLVRDDFAGNQSAAARQFGCKQGLISDFLNHKKTFGIVVLIGISRYTRQSVNALLGIDGFAHASEPSGATLDLQYYLSRHLDPDIVQAVVADPKRWSPLAAWRANEMANSEEYAPLSALERLDEAERIHGGAVVTSDNIVPNPVQLPTKKPSRNPRRSKKRGDGGPKK